MKVYLVGGAVRDGLLNLPIKDRDWVVVGATVNMLLKCNFQQVGKNFPVFLHPVSHEEYALARTEYKSGSGYYGFKTNFSPEVTLEEDLIRRDLTINAIAQDSSGCYIDPYFGKLDLKLRILRHISPSFVDDPLRVLRVARFAASLSHLGFSIAKETLFIMKSISNSQELLCLHAERIWKETEKALMTNNPHVYFQVLYSCNALVVLFPEINRLFNIEFSFCISYNFWNNQIILLKYLAYVSTKTLEIDIRVACLFQCFNWNCSIIGCVNNISSSYFLKRFNVPIYIRDLVILIANHHCFIKNIIFKSSYEIIVFLNRIDVWRRPSRIKKIAFLSNIHHKLFSKSQSKNTLPGDFLCLVYSVVSTITAKKILNLGFKGKIIQSELIRLRTIKLDLWRKNNPSYFLYKN